MTPAGLPHGNEAERERYLRESAFMYAATAVTQELRDYWLVQYLEHGGSEDEAKRMRND